MILLQHGHLIGFLSPFCAVNGGSYFHTAISISLDLIGLVLTATSGPVVSFISIKAFVK